MCSNLLSVTQVSQEKFAILFIGKSSAGVRSWYWSILTFQIERKWKWNRIQKDFPQLKKSIWKIDSSLILWNISQKHQIHKYKRTNIFVEKLLAHQFFGLSHTNIKCTNTQIHKYINTNTQISKFLTNSLVSLNLTAPTRMCVLGMSIVNVWKQLVLFEKLKMTELNFSIANLQLSES